MRSSASARVCFRAAAELGADAAQWAGPWCACRVVCSALTAPEAANLISKLASSAGPKTSEQPAFVLYDTFDDVGSAVWLQAKARRPCPSSSAMPMRNIRA